KFFYEDGSTLSMTSKTSDACVDELLDQVTSDELDRDAIQELIAGLSNATVGGKTKPETTSSSDESAVDKSLFEPLLGYYNVSYTLTATPKDNPVGGKWTRLWKVRRMLQHVLPTQQSTDSDAVVAQVVNAIRLELLFGMIGIWVVLRGDAVPLRRDEADKAAAAAEKEVEQSSRKGKGKPLLPNLSDRTVRVYFDKPRIGLSLFRPHKPATSDSTKALLAKRVLTLGPTSSVVLDTPYIDDRIRLGKGGTSGSQFVFARVPESDKEATDGWKWVTEASLSALNKPQIMVRVGILGIASILAFKLLQHTLLKRIAGVYAVISGMILAWLALSTGGIETRGDTYTSGR
ncbi:MAG: hypothetical protein SGILL_004170, partial [Bacillariaceae sp.]